MTLFFTATAVSPAIFPWEGSAKTLERLASCPVTIEAIVLGDMIASVLFGIGITAVTIAIGLAIGLPLLHGVTLAAAVLLAAGCFSAIGMLLAVPPTNVPSNIMMLSSLIKFPLVFISGIFVPLEQLPGMGAGACRLLAPDLLRRSCAVRVHRRILFPRGDRSRRARRLHAGLHGRHDGAAQANDAAEDVREDGYGCGKQSTGTEGRSADHPLVQVPEGELKMPMTETSENLDEAYPVEKSPAQGDPMALSGVEAAMFGLVNYCPVTLLGTKAVETICGDDRSDRISSTERVLRANVRLGYGITLAGLCCPIFWIPYLAGVTGVELMWHAVVSGLIAIAGLLLAGWYRVQLGRFRQNGDTLEGSSRSVR